MACLLSLSSRYFGVNQARLGLPLSPVFLFGIFQVDLVRRIDCSPVRNHRRDACRHQGSAREDFLCASSHPGCGEAQGDHRHTYTRTRLVGSSCIRSACSVLYHPSVWCTVTFLKPFTAQGVLCLERCSSSSIILCLPQISDQMISSLSNFPGAPQTEPVTPLLCPRALDAHLSFASITLQCWVFTASGTAPRPSRRTSTRRRVEGRSTC